jgi:hypothetical protein
MSTAFTQHGEDRAMERFVIKAMTLISKAQDNFTIDEKFRMHSDIDDANDDERGDVPGWVLVVLMTTGLVTAIWTIAAPRLSTILRNSLDAMNGIR